jgi:hypothetical protein
MRKLRHKVMKYLAVSMSGMGKDSLAYNHDPFSGSKMILGKFRGSHYPILLSWMLKMVGLG